MIIKFAIYNISYKISIEGESPFLSYSYRIGANSKFDNQ